MKVSGKGKVIGCWLHSFHYCLRHDQYSIVNPTRVGASAEVCLPAPEKQAEQQQMTHRQLKNAVRVWNRVLRRSRRVLRCYLPVIRERHGDSLEFLSMAEQAAGRQVHGKIAAIA